jgi:hypothetical protein
MHTTGLAAAAARRAPSPRNVTINLPYSPWRRPIKPAATESDSRQGLESFGSSATVGARAPSKQVVDFAGWTLDGVGWWPGWRFPRSTSMIAANRRIAVAKTVEV